MTLVSKSWQAALYSSEHWATFEVAPPAQLRPSNRPAGAAAKLGQLRRAAGVVTALRILDAAGLEQGRKPPEAFCAAVPAAHLAEVQLAGLSQRQLALSALLELPHLSSLGLAADRGLPKNTAAVLEQLAGRLTALGLHNRKVVGGSVVARGSQARKTSPEVGDAVLPCTALRSLALPGNAIPRL